jgi:hypothetical protein
MKNLNFRLFLPHLVAIVVFLFISLAYFYPLLQGKSLRQGDIVQFQGMSKEIADFRDKTGEEALWTNSMFGGMPAYQISVIYYKNFAKYIDTIISFNLPVPAKYLFLSLLGFYILLLAFRVDPWLAIAGALAFGFSTYFFIIEAAGHNTKAHAMTYMAPIIAGIVLSFRGKLLLGAMLTGLFLSLQLFTNHLQITYYTLIIVILFGLFELFTYIRERRIFEFFKTIGILLLPVILAVGMNITNLWLTWEYSHYSTRGKSELSYKQDIQTSGLDKDYILNDYSYGISETMNLLIPDFKGRSSSYSLGRDSEVFRVLQQNSVQNPLSIAEGIPTYWGPQRYTAGPVYIGATVLFLFVFGLFLLKGRLKWWLFSATILSILLAWGKHLYWFSDFFIDFVPGYNKFRTVSMILVIAELTIPFLGVLAVSELFHQKFEKKDFLKAMKYSFYGLGGIVLLFALLPGAFLNFSGGMDKDLLEAGYPQFLIDALAVDRQSILRADAFRSFVFIVLTAGLIFMFYFGKIKRSVFILGLALLFVLDLGVISRRFLNDSNYVSKRESRQIFQPTPADLQILMDDDPNYRVFNLTRSPFNDAVTSYFHKSIGGYHGAKMGRYQDVIDLYLSKFDMSILNMLNTKYFILSAESHGIPLPQYNPDAMGNAWFVDEFVIAEDADEEIMGLQNPYKMKELKGLNLRKISLERKKQQLEMEKPAAPELNSINEEIQKIQQDISGQSLFNPSKTAIVRIESENLLKNLPVIKDSLASISLKSYRPNHLVYTTVSDIDQLAVFSEIFYSKGWEVTVSGEKAEHFRVNYLLRGMVVPSGEHVVEFRFRPKAYFIGEKIALVSSVIMLLLAFSVIYLEFKKLA